MIVAGIDLDHDDLAVFDRYDSTYGSCETVYDAVEQCTCSPAKGSDGHHYDVTERPFMVAKTGKRVYVVDGDAK